MYLNSIDKNNDNDDNFRNTGFISKNYKVRNKKIPWAEKYRPESLKDIISHKEIVESLKKFVEKKDLPNMLFYGQPGTGKTSSIIACAKEIYKRDYELMVIELNASDDRGIETVRTKIKQFVTSFRKLDDETRLKLVIFDETDAMTNDAQAILRKIMEDYHENVRFCFICNTLYKVDIALQSRCKIFRYLPIGEIHIKEKLFKIAESENIRNLVTDDGVNTIIKISKGDLRYAINILQLMSITKSNIDEQSINVYLGHPCDLDIYIMFESILYLSIKDSYNIIKKIKTDKSLFLNDIINEIFLILFNHVTDNLKNVTNNSTLTNITDALDKIDEKTTINILDKIRTIEYNLLPMPDENIQLVAFISIFKL